VIIGQTFTSQLIAVNYCGSNVTIIDIATLSFPGVIESAITVLNTTTYYKNLSWTPTAAQLGYQVICAIAFDRYNTIRVNSWVPKHFFGKSVFLSNFMCRTDVSGTENSFGRKKMVTSV
jgi:hypothetical protein